MRGFAHASEPTQTHTLPLSHTHTSSPPTTHTHIHCIYTITRSKFSEIDRLEEQIAALVGESRGFFETEEELQERAKVSVFVGGEGVVDDGGVGGVWVKGVGGWELDA